MGKVRLKAKKSTGLDDVLPEGIGRKIVIGILGDDRYGSLKILLRVYSSKAIANYKDKKTSLTVLQFASIIGNVQAGKSSAQ